MTSKHDNNSLSPEEKEFVDQLAAHYTPAPMTPADRATFDRTLEERIAWRTSPPFLRPAAVVAIALAAVLLWFVGPYQDARTPDRVERSKTVTVVEDEGTHPVEDATLLTYAYYSTEFYGDEGEEEVEDFLPDEYVALASVFSLPGA